MSNEEKKGLTIVEENEFENEINEEELEQFYQENKEAFDIVGGLDMFESLMNLSDEQFEILKPNFLAVFIDTLNKTSVDTLEEQLEPYTYVFTR